MEEIFNVLDLLEIDSKTDNLLLKRISGENGLERVISSKEINRPGLALGGFFDFFANNRIQVFGRGETLFLKKYQDEEYFKNVRKFLDYDIPCCIFSNDDPPPSNFISLTNEKNIPVLLSSLDTGDLISALFQILNETFAKKTVANGVLVEVFGIGILIKGKSGIGKSETALELIERGHRLVADDTIELKNIQNKFLEGKGTKIISHHMEIKGIGIINVKNLFGVGAIRDEKKIQLIIELEEWDAQRNEKYERLGVDEKYEEILGLKLPYLLIPVMPGRNIPILIETAAMNQRMKMMGVNSAKEFNKELIEFLETQEIKSAFFDMD
ncbi:MAG TPA: HPr(Ser) kinase/phosphatase [Spirochaetota bacterium]|nr:HPr(Ser) kinase/phosphatase [Spirochaetota bacterium]